ncbi:MAG: hypothetical protein GAK43_02030 [Stenotrophomonas maltophilia]|nr:MAG: hypothetical protein GAK43_02030 [Stenotrophomonas maltophilia]
MPRLPLLLTAVLASLPLWTQAALLPLDNEALGRVTGQDGLSVRLDVQASIARIAWNDDGGSVSLRNVVIDNGCTSAALCPNGRGGAIALGPAQLGLSLPIFGVELPTVTVDVVRSSSGQQQLALGLPDLSTINEQLIASGLPAQTIHVRVAGDLYTGDNRLGSIEIRDIQDISGTIRVWGH